MSTNFDSESSTSSSTQSLWWTPSSWVPDSTKDPASTLSTSTFFPDLSPSSTISYSPTFSWTETGFSTATDFASSSLSLSSHSSSPTSIVRFSSTSSLSGPIETQLSHADSTKQSPENTPAKLKTVHIVGMSIGAFFGLLVIGSLIVYLFVRLGRRRPKHQRFYSDPDEKHNDDSATKTSFDSRGNDFTAAVRGMDRGDSLGERMPSRRILDRSYYNTRRSLSDGGATSTTPLLQPSLSPSDNRGLERETSSFGLGLNDIQYRSAGSFDEEFSGPSSPSDPPRYSGILPLPPILRPPRPLPIPKDPRPLHPQRRSDSIQIRMQTKPPLISSSTISLPLHSSPPSIFSSSPPSNPASGSSPPSSSSPSSPPSFTGLRNLDPFTSPIPEKLPPLLPQRRTEESIQVPPSSWSLSSTSLSPVSPFRPSPSVSFKEAQHPNASDNPRPKEFMKLKFRRKQQHTRQRSGQLGSPPLTSESFRCAGEKAMNDEDRDFFADEGVLTESPPSAYS